MTNLEVTCELPDMLDEMPGLPSEGLSDWERQEVRRLWGNVLREYRETAFRVERQFTRVAEGHPDSHPAANAIQALAQAVAAEQALTAHLNGIIHRQALAKKSVIDVDELANVIRSIDGSHSLGAGALAEAILAELGERTILGTT